MNSCLFVVSGSSGSGKTTIVNNVIKALSEHCALSRVVTYTTKRPRAYEKQGIDYHFISPIDFQNKINDNFFLEWSTDYGNYYGSPRLLLDELAQGRSFLLITDHAGVQSLAHYPINKLFIWLSVDLPTLKQRLYKRDAENQHEIEKRLAIAVQELNHAGCSSLYDYKIVNGIQQETEELLKDIVQKKLIL